MLKLVTIFFFREREDGHTSEHSHSKIASYHILPSQKTTLSIISYHFSIHPIFQNSIFFSFYLNILFYSFFYYFSFSLPFPLFLPQPLALATTNKTKTVQHTVAPTYPNTTHRTIKPKPKPH